MTDRAQHVDFLRVTAETKLAVEVPGNFTNEDVCPGLCRACFERGATRHRVHLPRRRHSDQIDTTSGPEIGEGVHISMVTLPDGVELTTDRDHHATIAASTVVAEETAAEGEEGEEGEEGAETEAEESIEEQSEDQGARHASARGTGQLGPKYEKNRQYRVYGDQIVRRHSFAAARPLSGADRRRPSRWRESFGDEADHFYERVRRAVGELFGFSNSMQPTSLFCMTN